MTRVGGQIRLTGRQRAGLRHGQGGVVGRQLLARGLQARCKLDGPCQRQPRAWLEVQPGACAKALDALDTFCRFSRIFTSSL